MGIMQGYLIHRAEKLVRLAVFSVLAGVILLDGLSRMMQKEHPALSLRLNPLNTEARISQARKELEEALKTFQAAPALEEEVNQAIRFSPYDARLYSLKAKIKYLQGDRVAAERLFSKALQVAPTERSALLYMIDASLRRQDFPNAIRYFDLLLRRWPELFDSVAIILPVLAKDVKGASLLRQYLQRNPPWRYRVFHSLLKHEPGQALLRSLLLEERKRGVLPNEGELSAYLRVLLKLGKIGEARSLFRVLLSEKKREEAESVIFDPGFRFSPSGIPFTWEIRQRGDVEMIMPWRGAAKGGLFLRFTDVPARLDNIRQTFVATPGKYELKVDIMARRLILPRGLYWDVYCIRPKWKRLARLSIPEGSYQEERLSKVFIVPKACHLLQLVLRTGVIAPSWRHRYRGEIIFREVNVISAIEMGGN